jgi:NADH-quinone oxidoreductase subunit H
MVFFFIFSWVKATVPRFRYDHLMRLGWKIFLPISLLWVFLVSGYLMLTRYNCADTPSAANGWTVYTPVDPESGFCRARPS